MTSMGSLARRYARSLFQLANEENLLDKFYQDLSEISKLAVNQPETIKALGNDLLDYTGRLNATAEIADKMGLYAEIKNFLLILVKKDRLAYLEQIIHEFGKYRDQFLAIVRVSVVQSSQPEEGLLKKVEELLGKKLGKKVMAKGEAKPDMIGGLILKIGNTTYNGSIQRELELLKAKMLSSEF